MDSSGAALRNHLVRVTAALMARAAEGGVPIGYGTPHRRSIDVACYPTPSIWHQNQSALSRNGDSRNYYAHSLQHFGPRGLLPLVSDGPCLEPTPSQNRVAGNNYLRWRWQNHGKFACHYNGGGFDQS